MSRLRVMRVRGSETVEMPLHDALAPSYGFDGKSPAEFAIVKANVANNAIGRLLAKLVEKEILSLSEAVQVSGEYGEFKLLTTKPKS